MVLPKGVESNVLTVKDSDSGDTRTRTYSYQGVDLYSAQISLPVSFEQDTLSSPPVFLEINGIDFLFPVMTGILGILCITESALIIYFISKGRTKRLKKR